MGLNLNAVGVVSEASERSWNSKDALLYALGVGAGALDPTGFELEFTTENSDGVTQRVLPSFSAIIGQGGGRAEIGDYDPAMLVHGEQSIRLYGEIPVSGTVSITTKVAGMYDKGAAALVVLESESRHTGSGALAFTNRTTLFIRGAGGFGGPRNPEGDAESTLAAEPLPAREPDEVVSYADARRSGAVVPAERGSQPAALGPHLCQAGGLRPPDPPRALHLRVHRARRAARRVRLGPGALRRHARPLLQADVARRHVDRLPVGRGRPPARGRTGSAPRPNAARRSSTPGCSPWRPAEPAPGSAAAVGAHAEDLDRVRHVAVAEVRRPLSRPSVRDPGAPPRSPGRSAGRRRGDDGCRCGTGGRRARRRRSVAHRAGPPR